MERAKRETRVLFQVARFVFTWNVNNRYDVLLDFSARDMYLLSRCLFKSFRILFLFFLRWENLYWISDVPSSFLLLFLPFLLSHFRSRWRVIRTGTKVISELTEKKFPTFEECFNSFFPTIPFHSFFYLYPDVFYALLSRTASSRISLSYFVFSLDSLPLFTIPFDPSLFFTLLRVHLGRKNDEVNRQEGGKRKKTVRDIVVEILKYHR